MKRKCALFFFLFAFFAFTETNSADGKTTAAATSALGEDEVENAVKVLSHILDAKAAKELASVGSVFLYKYKNADMKNELTPSSPLMKKITDSFSESDLAPVFLMEGLYLYKKENDKPVDVSKILRNISGLEGLTYYSHTRGKMRTLYTKSFTVKETGNGNKTVYEKIPDALEGEADGLKISAWQEDLTFGGYVYGYEYFTDGASCGMVCRNKETVLYSVFNIKVISPENLRIIFAVHDMEGFLAVYCRTEADFTKLPGLEKKLKNSFSSRAEALYTWFIGEYKKSAFRRDERF